MSKKSILLIICILSLTPLLWFKGSFLIAGGDQAIFLNPISEVKRTYLWDRSYQGGNPTAVIFHFFPALALFGLLNILGVSQLAAQKIWFILLYALPMFSMYYLYGVATKCKNSPGRLVAAIFYLFNIYFFTMNPLRSPDFLLTAAATPLMLAFCMRGLDNSSFRNKYIILIGLASIVISGVNLALFFVVILILLTYAIFFLVTNKRRVIPGVLFFGFMSLMLIFIINAWSLFVQFFRYSWLLSSSTQGFSPQSAWHVLDVTKVYDAFRLMGKWNWPLMHYYKFYDNFIFTGMSYLAPLFIFSVVLLGKIREKKIFYFLFLALLGVFLSKGTNPPLGIFYKWFYYHIPGSLLFREPYTKFTFIGCLSYAVLLGVAVDKVSQWALSKQKYKVLARVFPFVTIMILLGYVCPIFTKSYIKPNYYIKIPEYWKETNRWLNSQEGDFKVLELPQGTGGYMGLKWESGYYGYSNYMPYLLDRPLLDYTKDIADYVGLLTSQFYTSFYLQNSKDLGKLLGLMNVKYLHLRLDVDWQRHDLTVPEKNRECLKYLRGVDFVVKFDKSEIYENRNTLPLIYATRNIKFVPGKPKDYKSFEYLRDISISRYPVLIFNGQAVNPEIISKSNLEERFGYTQERASPPEINFVRLNSSKYKIKVRAKAPFCLVFEESFHPQWRAFVKGKEIDNHFIANGFANGYYIDQIGDYEIILEFMLQKHFYLVLMISILIVLGSLVYLVVRLFSKGKLF